MAPKIHPLSHRLSKKEQDGELSSDEESESQSPTRDKANSSDETEEDASEDEELDRERVQNDKPPIQILNTESKSVLQEDGSDSEPESEGVSLSNYKLQPIQKQPASSAKRARQNDNSSLDASESNKMSKTEENKYSPGCITRVWSNADEIAVLNGLIELKEEGIDTNSEGFYNFIKGKLGADFSKEQLRTKLKRMKKRFVDALKKGTGPVFSNQHEYKVFELSKSLWGDTIKETVKPEKFAMDENPIVMNEENGEEGEFWSKYPFLRLSFDYVAGNFPSAAMSHAGTSLLKERVSLIGNAEAKELNQKWRQLFVEETGLNHKMLALMTEQVRMALNK